MFYVILWDTLDGLPNAQPHYMHIYRYYMFASEVLMQKHSIL